MSQLCCYYGRFRSCPRSDTFQNMTFFWGHPRPSTFFLGPSNRSLWFEVEMATSASLLLMCLDGDQCPPTHWPAQFACHADSMQIALIENAKIPFAPIWQKMISYSKCSELNAPQTWPKQTPWHGVEHFHRYMWYVMNKNLIKTKFQLVVCPSSEGFIEKKVKEKTPKNSLTRQNTIFCLNSK